MNYVGIDLGQRGALVMLSEDGHVLAAHRTPLTGGVPDIAAARAIVASLPGPYVVWCEQPVKVIRGGTSDSGYTALCASLKFWKAAFGKTQINVVSPRAWQSVVLTGTQGKDKQRAINWCRVFVKDLDLRPGRCTADFDGLSDAACIAEYGRRVARASPSSPSSKSPAAPLP